MWNEPEKTHEPDAPTAPRIRAGQVVAHTHHHPSLQREHVRHGVVTNVHEPVVVGRHPKGHANEGEEFSAAHADVAWFGLDGLTTVPLDELDPID